MKLPIAFCLLALSAVSAVAAQPLLMEHATVLHPRGNAWLADRSILVEAGRIVAVAASWRMQYFVG